MKQLTPMEITSPLSVGQHDHVYYEEATSLVYIPRQLLTATEFVVIENDVLVEAIKNASLIGISTDGLAVELPDNTTAGLLVLTSPPPPPTGDPFTITWFGDHDWLNTGSHIATTTSIPVANNNLQFMNTVDERPIDIIPTDGYLQKHGLNGVQVMFANNTGSDLVDLIGEAYLRAKTTELATAHQQLYFVDRYHNVLAVAQGIGHNAFIHVTDCLSDATVTGSGSALYVWFYETEALVKLVEFDDMDIHRNWDDIIAGPNNQLVADILPPEEFDSMVDLMHTHHPYSIGAIAALDTTVDDNLIVNGNELADGFPIDAGFENWEWNPVVH